MAASDLGDDRSRSAIAAIPHANLRRGRRYDPSDRNGREASPLFELLGAACGPACGGFADSEFRLSGQYLSGPIGYSDETIWQRRSDAVMLTSVEHHSRGAAD